MALENPKLARLASLELTVDLPEETLAEIADLALRLHQKSSREKGALLSQSQRRPYSERSETEQLGLRSSVLHMVHALVLLDLVEINRL